ncbi:unnamed protein product, partial [Rangifer tarandus platyrhynchus]
MTGPSLTAKLSTQPAQENHQGRLQNDKQTNLYPGPECPWAPMAAPPIGDQNVESEPTHWLPPLP